jgi:hypothetical protein
MEAPVAFAEGAKPELCATKVAMARMCLRRQGKMSTVKKHLPKNYDMLSEEEKEWEMNHAILAAYEADKAERMELDPFTDDEEDSDDEEDAKIAEVRAKVDEVKKALMKAALAAFCRNRDE